MNHTPNRIHFKPDFLPTKFISDAFDGLFLSALASAFYGILSKHAATSDADWRQFEGTLKTHGLLELKIPTQYKPDDLRITVADRDGEKREVTYAWKEPLAFGFQHLPLPIERTRLTEPDYADEAAKILAYLFAWKLIARGWDTQDVVIISNLTGDVLDAFLCAKHAGEVSSRNLRLFLLERAIQAELDELPALGCFDRLKAKLRETNNTDLRSPRAS